MNHISLQVTTYFTYYVLVNDNIRPFDTHHYMLWIHHPFVYCWMGDCCGLYLTTFLQLFWNNLLIHDIDSFAIDNQNLCKHEIWNFYHTLISIIKWKVALLLLQEVIKNMLQILNDSKPLFFIGLFIEDTFIF